MSPAPERIDLKTVDSTNLYAKAHFAELSDGAMITAETQTAGRGREGRRWHSPPGKNLYCSFVFKHMNEGFHAGMIAGLALLETIREAAPELRAFLKWPNDLYCEDRKLAGMLCEGVTFSQGRVTGVIAGIGLNVNAEKNDFQSVPDPATSLKMETNREFHLKRIKESLAFFVQRYYIKYPSNAGELFSAWKRGNALLGSRLSVTTPDGREYCGIFRDIASDGAMLMECDGALTKFSCGDVRIRRDLIDWGRILNITR